MTFDRAGKGRAVAFALMALASLTGCDDPATTTLSFAVPTEVAVDPADFLGNVSCSSNEGAMRSYVMTLRAFENEDDSTAFEVGTTQPTPCSLITGFREVIVLGQRHIAEIDGFDVPADTLVPFGGTSSSSRQMRDVVTGEIVTPRWSTSCGTGAADGAVAVDTQRVFVRPCEPLADTSPTPTQIAIGPEQVLGDDACAVADSFDAVPDSPGLAPAQIACDGAPVTYEVAPDMSYDFYVTVTIDGVAQGSVCSATAIAGVTVNMSCNPLSATGRANIDLSGVMRSDDTPLCPTGSFFDVSANDAILNAVPLACQTPSQIGPLAPGVGLLRISVYDQSGQPLDTGSCGVEVDPGRTKNALCVASN